jgi:hypothetical protein
MKQFVKRLPALVVVIATTLLALLLGIALFYLLARLDARGRWEQLATPPGGVAHLVAGDDDRVTVATAAGAHYEVFCAEEHDDEICVRKVTGVPKAGPPCSDTANFPRPAPEDRESVLSCIEYEFFHYTMYVLREDGSLWRWSRSIYPYGQLTRFFQVMAVAFILGIAAGIALVTGRS